MLFQRHFPKWHHTLHVAKSLHFSGTFTLHSCALIGSGENWVANQIMEILNIFWKYKYIQKLSGENMELILCYKESKEE